MPNSEQPTVAINTVANPQINILESRYGAIYDYLEEHDVRPVFTVARADFDPQTGEFSKFYQLEREPGASRLVLEVGATAVDAALHVRLTAGRFESDLFPILNDERLRDVTGSKIAVYNLMPEAQAQTWWVPNPTSPDLAQAIAAVETEQVVIKRNRGAGGKYTVIATKQDATANVASAVRAGKFKPDEGLVVQAFAPINGPLPGLKGINDEQTAALKLDQAKELRVLMIDDLPSLAVVRLIQDRWVFIDQDSVPPEALELAAQICQLIRVQAGRPDSYIAADLFWNSQAETWQIREANSREPELISAKKNPEFAKAQRQAIGSKLVAMATRHRQASPD